MTGVGHDEAPDAVARPGGAGRPAPRHLHRRVQGAAGRVAERRRGGGGSLPPGHMGKIECTTRRHPPVRRHTHTTALYYRLHCLYYLILTTTVSSVSALRSMTAPPHTGAQKKKKPFSGLGYQRS